MKIRKKMLAIVLVIAMLLAAALPSGAADAKPNPVASVMQQLRQTKRAGLDDFYIYPYWNTFDATTGSGGVCMLRFGLNKRPTISNASCQFIFLKGSSDEISQQEEPTILDVREYSMEQYFSNNSITISWVADERYPAGDYTVIAVIIDSDGNALEQAYYLLQLHVVNSYIPVEEIKLFAEVNNNFVLFDESLIYPTANDINRIICVCPVLYPRKATQSREMTVTCSVPTGVNVWEENGYFYISAKAVCRTEVTFCCGSATTTIPLLFGNASSIALDSTNTELCPGQTDETNYQVQKQPGIALDMPLRWDSSNCSIVTVKDGVVTAVAPGKAVVSVTAGNQSASVEYTVHAHQLPEDAAYTPRTATQPACAVGHCSLCGKDVVANMLAPAVFADTIATAWYAPHVDAVYAAGLMNGTADHTFSPNKTLSRAMVVTVLYRMAGSPKTQKEFFSDVEDGKWYSDPISWAKNKNIVTGYPDGSFRPNQDITREQIATILSRYATISGTALTGSAELDTFPDSYKVAVYAKEYMRWAVGNGLITGVAVQGQTLLMPNTSATRAQFATIVSRFVSLFHHEQPGDRLS